MEDSGMKSHCLRALCVLSLALGCWTADTDAQATAGTAAAHVAAAKDAAKQDFTGLLNNLCAEPKPAAAKPAAPPAQTTTPPAQQVPPASPPASQWHADPAKVFDNLYFVGMQSVSAWALTTSDGIILIDALYDYSVEDEIVNGLTKLGLDPAAIKYVVVTHGHGDHYAGSKYLQDKFGARIVLSAPDWDLVERGRAQLRPRRDLVATDGQKLTLGDTTVTLHVTPGHTPGTVSLLVPLKDGNRQHLAAMWGGVGFNFQRTPEAFRIYSTSARRLRDIVGTTPVDVVLTNHANQDNTFGKIAALKTRRSATLIRSWSATTP